MGHQHPGLSDLLKTSTVAMILSWKTGGDCQLWVRDKLLPQVEELKYLRSFFFSQQSDGADWGCICNTGVVLVSCSEES